MRRTSVLSVVIKKNKNKDELREGETLRKALESVRSVEYAVITVSDRFFLG